MIPNIQLEVLLESSPDVLVKSSDGTMIINSNYLQQVLMYREEKFVPVSIQRWTFPK